MIESQLILPIRFYNFLTEQDRYKRHSIGVALTELNYPYVDATTLAPFQILGNEVADDLMSITWAIVCADTGVETALTYSDDHWADNVLDYAEHRTMYLGTQDLSAFTDNGLYYLKVVITYASGAVTYYSDLFMINNAGDDPFEIDMFRSWSSSSADLRAIDTTDLRIV